MGAVVLLYLEARGTCVKEGEETRNGVEGFWAKVLERFASDLDATLTADLHSVEAIAIAELAHLPPNP